MSKGNDIILIVNYNGSTFMTSFNVTLNKVQNFNIKSKKKKLTLTNNLNLMFVRTLIRQEFPKMKIRNKNREKLNTKFRIKELVE